MAKLKKSDDAPLFSMKDTEGQSVELADYADSFVLLAFLRYSECPWCNLALHRLIMEQPLLNESKCKVIVFIQSSAEEIQSSLTDKHHIQPKFPIIPDPKMTTYHDYGVSVSVSSGLRHHIRHIPAWVHAVYKEGFSQKSINGEFFLAPAAVLLAPGNQKVIRADYDADFYEHESFSKIYDAIADYEVHGL